jgi:hypothetical protein
MQKVVPTNSAEREINKFQRAVEKHECRADDDHFDQVVRTLVKLETMEMQTQAPPAGTPKPPRKD